jgi:hypothetical protein
LALITIAGAATAAAGIRRYRSAPSLQCACGLAWVGPYDMRDTITEAVGYRQDSVPARYGAWQAFTVEFYNPSAVTQTVLGLTADELTGWAPRLAVTRIETLNVQAATAALEQAPASASIPPHTEGLLKYSVHELQCLSKGQVQYWTGIALRVRVGAFTRTEHVDFPHSGMAITGTGAPCTGHHS